MFRLALLHAWSGWTYENSTIIMPCIWIFTSCTRSRGKIFPAMAGNLLRNLLYVSYYCSKPFIKMQRIAMLYDIFEFEKGYNDINDK